MQSSRLSEDRGARMRRWHIRRTRGPLIARFVIPAMAFAVILSCSDGAVEPAPFRAPVATTVTVSPGSAALSALGETVRFTAEVRDQNGRLMAGAAVAWASSDASIATVDASGVATAAANGSATVTATAGSVSGTAAVTVAQVVNAVAVSPAADTLVAFGDTVRLMAEATDANGHAVAGSEFSWSSSDTLVARVDDSGLVTGVDEGTATVTAMVGDYSGTAEITTVENTDRAVLVALYEATGGLNWIDNTNWLTDAPLDDWYGVTIGSNGRVVGLDLSGKWDGRHVRHGLAGPIPPELGNLDQLEYLDLGRNELTGRIPPELGNLSELTRLRIGANVLSGRLPGSLTALSLVEFVYNDTELCVPTGASFRAWLAAIPTHEGTGTDCPPLSDREILEMVYDATAGPGWTNNENWLTDRPLEEWHGIRENRGRVTSLRLLGNNLTGAIPPELGELDQLDDLALSGNDLDGAIPRQLGDLTNLSSLGLGWNSLTGAIPPELGNLTKLRELVLWDNALSGPIPPELGNLANLEKLLLPENDFTGAIPAELGSLHRLKRLTLFGTSVSGAIPAELGNLDHLETVELFGNDLSGPIPPELGNLSSVKVLWLTDNDLSGPIPDELGHLSTLEVLWLDHNDLTGSVPPGFGKMSSLKELSLSNNARMQGPLPTELTRLGQLEAILAGGTQLCAPSDLRFQAWLDRVVHKRRIMPCLENPFPGAYLIQVVQSPEYAVPLLAGEEALLRVFPMARKATSQGIPAVRARFYINGQETHVEDIPGQSTPIPITLEQNSLQRSANAEIPAEVIRPGLEMVIDVDPSGTLDPTLGVVKRIPAEGRLAVDVRAMPLFDLTLIPFIWTEAPDSSIVDLIEAAAADPENHELLKNTRTLLPISEMRVTAHAPVATSSNGGFHIRDQTEVVRLMEGGTGHYMGMLPEFSNIAGVAFRPGRSAASVPYSGVVAHELGHNMNLQHAPCGTIGDPAYPYPDGSIGAWGYDFLNGGRLVPNSAKDLMSYCSGRWIGDYHFTNALRYRLFDEGASTAKAEPATRSLLLWGGVDPQGAPYLEPAFVVDAPAALPDSAGEHRVVGRTASGGELFSLSFTMPEVADGDGSSSFAFVLPVQAGWEEILATVTLSGPEGSATLDRDSDIPMAILRDPRSGQLRGFLRDLPPMTRTGADAMAESAGPRMEVLFSRGIPGADAWRW